MLLEKLFKRSNPKTKPATKDDYRFIAEIVYGVLGFSPERKVQMQRACLQDDTLYSWKNTTLLYLGKEVVGGMIAYPGKKYPQMKEKTWDCCWDFDVKSQEDECEADEYYVDSFFLLPEYRGHGYGKALLDAAEAEARKERLKKISLLVDKDNGGLLHYYMAKGYVITDNRSFLGKPFFKMTKKI